MRARSLGYIVVLLLAITINFDQFDEYSVASSVCVACSFAYLVSVLFATYFLVCTFNRVEINIFCTEDTPIPTRNSPLLWSGAHFDFHSSMKMTFFFFIKNISLTNAPSVQIRRRFPFSRRLIIFYCMWKCRMYIAYWFKQICFQPCFKWQTTKNSRMYEATKLKIDVLNFLSIL